MLFNFSIFKYLKKLMFQAFESQHFGNEQKTGSRKT